MQIVSHIIFSILFCIVLYPFFGLKILIVFLSGVLVDADHYLLCIFKNRNFSIRDAYDYHRNEKRIGKDLLEIFHTFEFWLLLFILGFYYYIFLVVLLGVMFHTSLDGIDLCMNYNKIKGRRAWSLTRWMLRRVKKIL